MLSSIDRPLVTCEAVIAEACFLVRRLRGAAADILHEVRQGRYQIPFRLIERSEPVAKLMVKYADQPMDLADARLVDMATQLKTGHIITLDDDFHRYRWGKNRPFEMLIDV